MEVPYEPVLGKMPDTVEISNSEIQTFKQCRRRWMLGNYYGLAKNESDHTGPLPLGTRVHNTLEIWYSSDDPKDEDIVDVYNRLQRKDAKLFQISDQFNDEKAVKKFNDESTLGRIMVEGYPEWLDESGLESKLRFVSAEEKLEARIHGLHDDRVVGIGKVDQRVERAEDGTRAVRDFKTAKDFNMYMNGGPPPEQLMLYCILEMLDPSHDNEVDGAMYTLLRKVKRSGTARPPFYYNLDVRFNKKTLAAFWTRLWGTYNDMMNVRNALDAGTDHRLVAYPSPSRDCSWICPFYSVCPMMDDGSSADRYLEDHFKQVDPLERYKMEEEEKHG